MNHRRLAAVAVLATSTLILGMGPALGSTFPGENGRVVFTSNRTGSYEIYSMARNGTDVQRLTRNTADDGNPVWSADGKRIVFASNRTGNSEIFIMNADGSGQRNLSRNYTDCTGLTGMDETTCNAQAEDGQPSFSPDGKQIVFVSFRTEGLGLWVMNVDGSKARQLTEGGVQPTWSPDGTWIAYSDGVDQGDEVNDDAVLDTDIFVVRPDGTGKRSVSNVQGAKEFAPTWSPDGRRIAFASDESGTDQVYVMEADGSGRRQLTRAGANTDPAWSADGRFVYVTSTRKGNSDIVRMSVDGSGARNLTRGSERRDLQPNSQPR